MITKEALGALVKKMRVKRGLSIDELSAKTDISRSCLYKIESGEAYPRVDIIDSIFKGLEYRFQIGGGRTYERH